MREIKGFFDKLHFTESILGPLSIDKEQLRIPVKGLFILAGHPLSRDGFGPFSGNLVFEGTASSRRTITEYIGDAHNPSGFATPYDVVDEIPKHNGIDTDGLFEFGFEGSQESPSAWIDNWIVVARSFTFQLP